MKHIVPGNRLKENENQHQLKLSPAKKLNKEKNKKEE
jgi:hypothetical protein